MSDLDRLRSLLYFFGPSQAQQLPPEQQTQLAQQRGTPNDGLLKFLSGQFLSTPYPADPNSSVANQPDAAKDAYIKAVAEQAARRKDPFSKY